MSRNFLQHTKTAETSKPTPNKNRTIYSTAADWLGFWKEGRPPLPHSCYLVFHFQRSELLVDRVKDLVALVSASSPVKAGKNDAVRAGEVRAPVQLEPVADPLAAGAPVPAQQTAQVVAAQQRHCRVTRGELLTRRPGEGIFSTS